MSGDIRASLGSAYTEKLVDELLASFEELRHHYYAGGLRLSEVEGGRFCEAAFRMLEEETTGSSTPLGRQLDTDRLIRELAQLPASGHSDSVRLHIPRALRMVYDIRNKRDAAHLADGIDPNLQDASLVVATTSWVMAEFLRLHHSVSADEAQSIVEALVTRRAPSVQDFDGYLKVLDPSLTAGDHCLLVLYQKGASGATIEELTAWARPAMRPNLRRTLHRLEHDRALVHSDGSRYRITFAGERHVEDDELL